MAMLKFVPLLMIVLMVAATILRGIGVARQTGVSPWAFVEARGRQRILGILFAVSFALVAYGALQLLDGLLVANAALVSGSLLTIVGTVLLIIAQIQMGAAWRVGFRESDAPLFVRSGLFRFSRNPIFLGMILIAIGTGIATGFWWVWLAAAVFAVACHLQVLGEEAHLGRNFGADYAAFKAAVPRWLGIGRIGI